MTNFTCYLVGNESLLLQCADILLRKNHIIRGIITSAHPIESWASKHDIPVHAFDDTLIDTLKKQPFDYFFSITNLKIIPDAILALPQKAAINFHDGPLPRYAGLYATSWALLNRESRYGISWHTMETAVDAGDILEQVLFDISSEETAFSLNIKCYQAGIDSFERLVDALAHGRETRTPQNLAEQTYFGKHKRPQADATLLWDKPAVDLVALVRALDFGGYENPLALPKLWTGQSVYYPTKASVLDATTTAAPGTILATQDGTLEVATGRGVVAFHEFKDLVGEVHNPADIAQKEGWSVGTTLPTLTATQQDELSELHKQSSRYETFWLKALRTLKTVELPYANYSQANKPTQKIVAREMMALPSTMSASRETADHLMTLFGLYLARLTGTTQFDLGYTSSELHAHVGAYEALFATAVPFSIVVDDSADNTVNIERTREQLARVHTRKTYNRDALLRYPSLPQKTVTYPILVAQLSDIDAYTLPEETELAFVLNEDGTQIQWIYDPSVYATEHIVAMIGQFLTFVENVATHVDLSLSQIPILSVAEREQLMVDWNDTHVDYPRHACIHTLFEQQVTRTPDAVAVVFEEQSLTYRELNTRANQLAHYLVAQGVQPDMPVGIYMDRSLNLLVGLFGILKAGGAYLPLDPEYPADRLAFMVEDAEVSILVTEAQYQSQLPPNQATIVQVDADWSTIAQEPQTNTNITVSPQHLSYVIYTSGSTGKPKGVMVCHGNAVNFFAGMDERIPVRSASQDDRVWLAVTSLSFDISVLELFWTLARGFKVVLYADTRATDSAPRSPYAQRNVDFGLFYFASDASEKGLTNKYKLLLEGAKYADKNGFTSVWTPERHFHAFGGLYPNPAVTGAAIAAITENVRICAGSCVLPLHHPVRVVEEWSVVDNLSNGRVGISLASGWQPNDFILKPERFENRKAIMFEDMETVKALWRGETISFPGHDGKDVPIQTLPRPVQSELSIWVTAANNPETFRMAGEGGYYLLTHLLGQTTEELSEKLAIYREAWRAAGHPGNGYVSLMLHTFVGPDMDVVRELVREPLKAYLLSAVHLVVKAAWHFPTFKQKADSMGKDPMELFKSESLSAEETEAVLEFAFERYFNSSGLFGTPESCQEMIDRVKAIQVDEIACQIDFGVPSQTVLEHLPYLNEARQLAKPRADYSIPALIQAHNVTHFQCTPSMASMLLVHEENRMAFSALQTVMLGGEAMPASLANDICALLPADGHLVNMYGPTETTIWSSTYHVEGGETAVPIGRPIANTQLYIVDKQMNPVPVGVRGELLIGGDGVVRGYLNRPQLTAERFIADPFSADPTARLYRTGDLASYRPDGNIDFFGRMDFQVKLRGYRIELGEIESLLNEHPTVRESVVMVREDVPGDKRIVAYLLANGGQTPSAPALRDYLRAQLPAYMVPAHFVALDAFPLTPNKKTDRKALPAPADVKSVEPVTYTAPQNDLESTIADIWRELLHVKQVGVTSNVFDLGAHSLLVVQAHRLLRESANGSDTLTITDMFRFPTIRSLANFVSNQAEATRENQEKIASRATTRRKAMASRRRRSNR